MNKGKKIIFILGSMSRGGAERVISILANEYAKKGWSVSIVMLLRNEVGYELDSRVDLVDLTGGIDSRIKRIPYWLKSIRLCVKQIKPDVIVAFAARINVLVQLACMGLKEKIIVSERNDPRFDGRGKLTEMLTRFLYPKASRVVFQTKRAMSYFNKNIQRNGVIIYNPIQVQEYASNKKKKKIVSVGRLDIQKNHKLLINSFSEIAKENPDYELWIYGKGELLESLKEEAKRLGIINKVFMPGNVPDVHRQIADAEVFVLSSDFEGLSNALLEAMMMGLSCISTNCAGADEVIIDGENGLLVDVGDVIGLSEAMKRVISDKEFAQKLAINAKKTSEKFKKDVILKQWEMVIE